jgi:hypothetical protein
MERLAEGLASEAASSDDVTDRESAMAFLELRMDFFKDLLDGDTSTRLRDIVQAKIEAW